MLTPFRVIRLSSIRENWMLRILSRRGLPLRRATSADSRAADTFAGRKTPRRSPESGSAWDQPQEIAYLLSQVSFWLRTIW